MAVIRMMAGGHFPSDTIFAGVFTFLIIWLAYALIYRWRTRLDDKTIETALERASIFRWFGRAR
jgi:lipid A 4'-phosphatase